MLVIDGARQEAVDVLLDARQVLTELADRQPT